MAETPFDPNAAAQLREISPDREQVTTWHQFRALAFRVRDDVTGEVTGIALEFRSMDGREIHQYVLDEETREMIRSACASQDTPSIVVPS